MKYKYITSIFIITFTLFVSLISIITPDKKISNLEGRELQNIPIPRNIIAEDYNENRYIYEMLTGEIFKKYDNYFNDHIYLRDNMVNSYVYLQEKLEKKYINGVYLGEDNYIFSTDNSNNISYESLEEMAKYFNEFAEKFESSKTYIVNIPSKSMVYGEKFPTGKYTDPQNTYADYMLGRIDEKYINVLDFRSTINKNNNFHYKTDHHLNMDGIYALYRYIIENINRDFEAIGEPKEKSDFNIDRYINCFVGSAGRKVAQLVDEGDDIEIYNYKDNQDYKIYDQNGESRFIYYEKLSDDKLNNDYEAYLNGDNPIVKIENLKSNNDMKIVMIGDSMDNPLLQFLMPHFNEIYSFDLRQYNKDIIKSIEEIDPDIIICIGLTNQFIQKTDIFRW